MEYLANCYPWLTTLALAFALVEARVQGRSSDRAVRLTIRPRSRGGCLVADFVRYALDDGTQVLFESAESNLVGLHGGEPEVSDGGRLTRRLRDVAAAAEEVSQELRSRLAPD